MERRTKQLAALLAATSFGLLTPKIAWADWTPWNWMGEHGGINLEYATDETPGEGTSVRFKVYNGLGRTQYVTIKNKKFYCGDGNVETRADETFGNVDGDSVKGLIPDHGLCKARGGVQNVRADLYVEDPL